MFAGKFFIGLSLFSILAISACKKDETPNNTSNYPQDNYFSLKQGDSTTLVFPAEAAANASGRATGIGYQLTDDSTGTTVILAAMGVYSSDSILAVIRKRVPKSLIGTYDLNFNPVFIAQGDVTSTYFGSVPLFFESLSITDPFILATYSGTGKLQITKYDASSKKISGTFNFTSKVGNAPKATVTQGVFNGIPLVQ